MRLRRKDFFSKGIYRTAALTQLAISFACSIEMTATIFKRQKTKELARAS